MPILKVKTEVGRVDRKNKRTLAFHVDPELYRHFKILAAEAEATTDAMLHEALWLLFERYQKKLAALRRPHDAD